ncbi:MAG: GAP family protein [Pleurocapsa minor GSE-CHR-MK-17-07R]|jgi:cytochrome c biogenesis protein CcdA|nr:GAP family protein [Pleurocapsa minor GSE-CHR-MK 17-07R]
MTIAFLLGIAGLAIADSLNPSLFIAQFYLLTTPKPVPRILTYILGIFVAYLLGGLVILLGLREVIGQVAATIPATISVGIQLVLGIVFLAAGLRLSGAPRPPEAAKKPRLLTPWFTFFFGMFVNLNELTTALPYFVALERISVQGLHIASAIIVLVAYNIIFCVPLLIFLWLFIRNRSRFEVVIERFQGWMSRWMPRLLKIICLILGVVLTVNSIPYFLFGRTLF